MRSGRGPQQRVRRGGLRRGVVTQIYHLTRLCSCWILAVHGVHSLCTGRMTRGAMVLGSSSMLLRLSGKRREQLLYHLCLCIGGVPGINRVGVAVSSSESFLAEMQFLA